MNKKIIVVEDNGFSQEFYKYLLKREEYAPGEKVDGVFLSKLIKENEKYSVMRVL